ncbi:MAG: hypothetical protein ACOC6E_02440 [Thermodesulfobacteriota bacterium]
MRKKGKHATWAIWTLTGAGSLMCLMSCSSLKEFVGWNKYYDSNETRNAVSDEGIQYFMEHVRPYQGNPDTHYGMGCYYQTRGKHRLPIREFEKTVSLNPNHVKGYNRMAVS